MPALPPGTRLHEYKIDSVLGSGGFGITYLARDIQLMHWVVIKEYLPREIAVRKGRDVTPRSGADREAFTWGLARFLEEARTLARFKHPNIVRVTRFFEAHGTGYFVMDYEPGEDLDRYLQQRKTPPDEGEILNIILPILDGLREMHKHDYLHRDIKPANIFLRRDGSPMLIDFGASRAALREHTQALSVMLTGGYAPKEQYSAASVQRPYTDIYAIGAVMYKMATGFTPTEASLRTDAVTDDEPDPLIPLQQLETAHPYSDTFRQMVDHALALRPKERPQRVEELQIALMTGAAKAPASPPKHPAPRRRYVAAAAALLVLLAISGYLLQVQPPKPPVSTAQPPKQPATQVIADPVSEAQPPLHPSEMFEPKVLRRSVDVYNDRAEQERHETLEKIHQSIEAANRGADAAREKIEEIFPREQTP